MTTYQALAENTETTVHAVRQVAKTLHIGNKMTTAEYKKLEKTLNAIADDADYIYGIDYVTADREKIIDFLADNLNIDRG